MRAHERERYTTHTHQMVINKTHVRFIVADINHLCTRIVVSGALLRIGRVLSIARALLLFDKMHYRCRSASARRVPACTRCSRCSRWGICSLHLCLMHSMMFEISAFSTTTISRECEYAMFGSKVNRCVRAQAKYSNTYRRSHGTWNN